MYKLIAIVITALLSPIIIPIVIYIGLRYRWEDTVPTSEDLDYE